MSLRFTRLDRKCIRALKPGEKIAEHGIIAERLKTGDVRYSVNIMVDGERIHRVIGRESEGTTRTQAEDFIEAKRTEAREGRLQLPKGRKTHLSFATAAKLYLESEREIGAKDLVSKEAHLRLHLVPYFGSMRIDRISKFTVEKFRKHMLAKEYKPGKRPVTKVYKPGNINRILSTYRHVGNRLVEQGHITLPLPMVKLGALENRRERILEHEEEAALLNAALNDSNAYSWLFVKVGLSTGLRHTEIVSAQVIEGHRIRGLG